MHLVAVLLAIPVASASLTSDWRPHGRILPLVLRASRLAALAPGLLADSRPLTEAALTVAGAIALAGAHIGNWRLMSRA